MDKKIRLFLTESINRIDKSTSQTNSLEINVFLSFFHFLSNWNHIFQKKNFQQFQENESTSINERKKIWVRVRRKYFILYKATVKRNFLFFCFHNVYQSPHTHFLCISHIIYNNKTRHLFTAKIVILMWTCFEHEKSKRKSTTGNSNNRKHRISSSYISIILSSTYINNQ